MASIPEQLAAASITDTLKYAVAPEETIWAKLVWAFTRGTFNSTGWHPPGYSKHEPDGSNGGAWLKTKKLTGGNAFVYLASPTFGTSQAAGGIEFRQRSVWLFSTGEGTANGYQLCCMDTTSGASKIYQLSVRKFVGGARTVFDEFVVEIDANGAFALGIANGKLSAFIRLNEETEWVAVGGTYEDTTFKEGFSGIDANGSNPTLTNFTTGTLSVQSPSAFAQSNRPYRGLILS